jgi:hypothetical protein
VIIQCLADHFGLPRSMSIALNPEPSTFPSLFRCIGEHRSTEPLVVHLVRHRPTR